jgi:hypothetical protein
MMPSAARSQCDACASAKAAGSPAWMRSTGSGSMITPVENGSTCSGAMSSRRAAATQGRACAHQAVFARAGVGVAGVDDHRADVAAGQVVTAHLHRRGAEAVLGEHARHRRSLVEQEDREVLAVRLADAGLGHADAHAGDGVQRFARSGRSG